MGMSASQARLLSITSRLTNNEFRAQTITNSKLRLAEKSQEASQKYMDALNTKQLMFGTYDENGDYQRTLMTPALLYQYQPLKNQYTMINNAGKTLVSALDAKNFEETESLIGFLDRYGLVEDKADYATEKVEVDNPEYIKQYEEWQKECAEIKKLNNSQDLSVIFSNIVGTSENPKVDDTGSGTGYCYKEALNGNPSCYLHLLNHLLDFDDEKINWPENGYLTSVNGLILHPSNTNEGGMGHCGELKDVSAGINATIDITGKYLRLCDGKDDLTKSEKNNSLEGKTNPSNLDILMSDYYKDENGEYQIKSLRQKIIDLYFIIQNQRDENYKLDAPKMKELLINFTEGDMKKLTLAYPDKPSIPATIMKEDKITVKGIVKDHEKAQWYTNLWYMMNGSDSANAVEERDIYSSCGDVVGREYQVDNNINKKIGSSNYEVIEDNLYSSADWLQFVLEHGVVTLKQSTYYNPSEDSEKVPEITSTGYMFKSIAYTSATDIVSQDNETAIAIAEVKYKNTLTEIENKDKKFDQDLKKLDSEHNALQTEYESIKEVISKNVERSFKAFS